MKCVCISCFNYYDLRLKAVINYFKAKGLDTEYIISDFDHYSKTFFTVRTDDTIQKHVPAYKNNVSIMRLISHIIFSIEVYKELVRFEPDLIYCMFPPNSLVKAVAMYKKRYNAVIVMDCFDLWPESFPIKKHALLLKIPFSIWRKLRDKSLRYADELLVVSEYAKEQMKSIAPGIPTNVLRPALEQSKEIYYNDDIRKGFSFCYLGNVNLITDTGFGVKFLCLLAKSFPVAVHFIGEGQNLPQFVGELKNGGVQIFEHGVIFDIKEKDYIFSRCNFGLNIPKDEVKSSMSLKSVEYLRAGLPLINTTLGDTRKIVNEYMVGINIDNKDVNTEIKKFRALNSQALNVMHQNCIKLYQKMFAAVNYDELFIPIIQELFPER